MNHLPENPLSPEQQRGIMDQLYLLMGKQVSSYHRHHHMGNNSSVPVELAQELMESIEYTVSLAGGMHTHPNLEQALSLGQTILENKLEEAKSIFALVSATAPQWQTECRWEALRYLRNYLDHYDFRHLAHHGPDGLFYPILISPPEGIRGIESAIFYLNILWIENQIMAEFPEDVLEKFWNRLPVDTLNQCEQLLLNALGKTLLGTDLNSLTFEPGERTLLALSLNTATVDTMKSAVKRLCLRLNLQNEASRLYVSSIISQLALWVGRGLNPESLENLFI